MVTSFGIAGGQYMCSSRICKWRDWEVCPLLLGVFAGGGVSVVFRAHLCLPACQVGWVK